MAPTIVRRASGSVSPDSQRGVDHRRLDGGVVDDVEPGDAESLPVEGGVSRPLGADATACVARVSAARTYASPCTAGAGFRSPPRAGEPGQRRVSARRSRRRPADLDERSLGVVAFDGDAAVAAAHQAVPDSARLLSVEFVERVDVVTVAATASASESSTAPAEAAQATNAPAATVAS